MPDNKKLNAVLKLRKDSENNFNQFNIVLQDGEVAIVSTPFQGTRIKIGDGSTPFKNLKYDTLGLLANGFMNESKTVFSDTLLHPVNHDEHILFLDRNTGFLYYWDPVNSIYRYVNKSEVPLATDTEPGISKLYDTLADEFNDFALNIDGSVTQRAINGALQKIQRASQSIVFSMDDVDTEQLNTDFSPLQALQILD